MNTSPANPSQTDNQSGHAAPGGSQGLQTPAAHQGFDFWQTAHRALRGRYRLALALAAGGALTGATVGALLGKRLYSSTGLVRIASVLPQVMRETDQNRPIAMFDGFIQAQREVMLSRETIQAAMKAEPWQHISDSDDSMSDERFASSLKVETRPRSDHIRVTFTNSNPAIAAAAVQSMIAAFQQAFTREQQRVEDQRLSQLQSRRAALQAELEALETENATVQGHTAGELDTLQLTTAERVRKLRSALVDVQCALAGGPDITLRQAAPARLPAEIAADETLRSAIAELSRTESMLDQARSNGYAPAHRIIMRLEAGVQACRERVAAASRIVDDVRAATNHAEPAPSPVSLTEREASLQTLTKSAEDEMRRLTAMRTQLAAFEEKAAVVRQSLRETEARMDELSTEASLGSRLTVISGGDKPMTAVIDNRAKAAAVGGLFGLILPVGCLVLLGTVRRRYRVAVEVAADLMEHVPFVAVVPDLNGSQVLNSPAARSIHDLRVRLQPTSANDPRTYLVTSASSGEGKSSIVVALGLSFAAAGFRTLVVDCDLATRHLSSEFNASEAPGMIEATAGVEPAIQRVRSGLSVLPAGKCRPNDAARLAPAATARVLAAIRDRFDVVLIDSDPILSGLTPSVIAPQVDGVVLTLARDQEHTLVQSAANHLRLLGAKLVGAVFNRAAASDFRAVLHAHPESPVNERVLSPKLHRFGPLVGAVLSSLSLTRDDDLDLMTAGMSLARTDEAPSITKAEKSKRDVA